MSRGSFAEQILFAEDMIMYFMKKYGLEWTPGTDGKFWNGHPRRFTEAMGFVASYLAHLKRHVPTKDRAFDISVIYKPTFFNGYNTRDFLHCCGLLAWTSVKKLKRGEYNVADGIVLSIVTYLRDITEDGSFYESGGWDALAKYADSTLNKMQKSLKSKVHQQHTGNYYSRLAI